VLDDGQILPLRELLAALEKAKGRYIALGPQQFLALESSVRRRLDLLRNLTAAGPDGLRMHRFAAPALEDVLANAQTDEAWRAHVERLTSLVDPAVPETFQGELRDYQVEGFKWLARLAEWGAGACLADDMGLGKTVQTLALILLRSQTRGRGSARWLLPPHPLSQLA